MDWPSRDSGEYERLLEPEGRTYFGGGPPQLLHRLAGGAIDSARKVVTELHRRVLATP